MRLFTFHNIKDKATLEIIAKHEEDANKKLSEIVYNKYDWTLAEPKEGVNLETQKI